MAVRTRAALLLASLDPGLVEAILQLSAETLAARELLLSLIPLRRGAREPDDFLSVVVERGAFRRVHMGPGPGPERGEWRRPRYCVHGHRR